MAYRIPTTQEAFERIKQTFENELNQTVPAVEKAFVNVISRIMAMVETSLSKFGADRAQQNFALTADLETLKSPFGEELGVEFRGAVQAQYQATLPGTNGTVIQGGWEFVGDPNNARYTVDSTVTITGGLATLDLTAREGGVSGNLNVGDTMTIGTQIAGAESTATVTVETQLGIDAESIETYRQRILTEERTVGGGGNTADYKTWALEVTGVTDAFPYSGRVGSDVDPITDGNMEAPTPGAWTAGNSATLTKDTAAPHSGVRDLKITYNAVNDPYAFQSSLDIGTIYTVNVWAKGDGTYKPSVRNGLSNVLWEGTTSTSYQEAELNFTAQSIDLMLFSNATGAGFVHFDDLTVLPTSAPGDRTVYVEVDTTIDPDGIPPDTIIEEVRDTINTDPDTGIARPSLGDTDETLFVEPIARTAFFVEIRNLSISAAQEASTKTSIETALRGLGFRIGQDRYDHRS
jgi:hypothetical protein